ncbi:MAG: SRPBCC family protein [Planctomycetes bacterium]|nr:SRPBCC family protein [Planctomycetota bacterium]
MPAFETALEIHAAPQVVWDVLSRVTHWPDWTPTVTAVEALTGPELRTGAQFLIRQPRLRPAVWTVSSVTPGTEFTWQMSVPGVHASASHVVTDTGRGMSQLKLQVVMTGMLAPLLWWLVGRLTRQYVVTEAESLKKYVER